MTPALPLLDIRALVKSYGGARVVDGVSLSIAPGECLGVIGPNGAGKTTTIRLALGLTAPEAGQIHYFARADGTALAMPRDALAIKQRLGVVSQFDSLDPDFSCAENLFVFGRYFGLGRAQLAERVPQLLEFAALAHKAGARPSELSGGMRRRLSLARALINNPDLLLLDEPTTGVDPVSRREFWRILAGLHREGRTVLVATPYMDEAERCTDIAFLDNGRITRAGTPEQIKAQVPGRLVEVTSTQPRRALAIIEPLAGVGSAHLLGDVVRVLWSAPSDPSTELGAALRAGGLAEAKVSPADIDMETVFAFLAETATTDHEPVRS